MPCELQTYLQFGSLSLSHLFEELEEKTGLRQNIYQGREGTVSTG